MKTKSWFAIFLTGIIALLVLSGCNMESTDNAKKQSSEKQFEGTYVMKIGDGIHYKRDYEGTKQMNFTGFVGKDTLTFCLTFPNGSGETTIPYSIPAVIGYTFDMDYFAYHITIKDIQRDKGNVTVQITPKNKGYSE